MTPTGTQSKELIQENSSLRLPPETFSRTQIVYLDAIRYAAEMANIAYQRLFVSLQELATSSTEPRVVDGASALLDAWSIVDSVDRFRDMVSELPGLPNQPWKRLLHDRTAVVAALRDCVQHQRGQLPELLLGGQIWGYLSWAEFQNGRHTGKWMMFAGGSVHVGDEWIFIGPNSTESPVPDGRIRLNAFGKRLYLGCALAAVVAATHSLSADIDGKVMLPRGTPATSRRGADAIFSGHLEVAISNVRSRG
jgi:hypothetical protein